MSSSGVSTPNNRAPAPKTRMDPVLLHAMRYSISDRDYHKLHHYLLKRSPRTLQNCAPSPATYEAALKSRDDYNAAAVRASLRLFVASQAGLKLWDGVKAAIARLRKSAQRPAPQTSAALLSPNTSLSLSLSMLLLTHRLLHRFMTRLRVNLLTKSSQPFRKRNPRISRGLTARLAPAIGASLAGFSLAAYPADQFRLTVAIYASTRAVEFAWNALEAEGWFKDRLWWWGSWMFMPPVFGELLYAFVFDKDCFPKPYGDFILKYSPNYVQLRPTDYPSHLSWPDENGIIGGMAEIARLHYPAFESPILHPKALLPSTLSQIAPITSPAHPAHTYLSCALLHPSEPSCIRTYLTFFLRAFPQFAKFFAIVLAVFSLPNYKAFLKDPLTELNKLGKSVLRLSLCVTGAIATSWGSICLFQTLFPRGFVPKGRFFLGGFAAGFWALFVREGGRPQFLYSLRSALDSGWKLGVKKGWWRGRKGGDVLLFALSLAVINVVYERNAEAVNSGLVRKALAGLRGDGWKDVVKEANEDEKKSQ